VSQNFRPYFDFYLIGTELRDTYYALNNRPVENTAWKTVMWIRIQEQENLPKFKNKPGFLAFKKLRRYVFWPLTYVKYIFMKKMNFL